MEKMPGNNFNKVQKVAKAAQVVRMAANIAFHSDPSHVAINPVDHTANINKKPETEIAQIQQQNTSKPQSMLDEQLKKTTSDYFGQDVNRTNKGDPQSFDTSSYKDFRRSQNIEDRRTEDNSLKEQVTAEEMNPFGEMVSTALPPGAYRVSDSDPIGKMTPLGEKLGGADIEKSAARIHEEVTAKIAKQEAQTEAQYEAYRKITKGKE